MKKVLASLLLTLVLVGFYAKPAEATFNPQITICHNQTNTITISISALPAHLLHGDHVGACVEVTPSVTPTPSISVSPTVTPTPEITENPCDLDAVVLVLKDDEDIVPCVSPTLTPEPTNVPQPLTVAGPPSCDGVPFVKLPANVHVVRNGDNAEVRWTPTQGGEVSIFFFENQHPDNRFGYKTNNDGHDVVHFLGKKDWTFEVLQWDGCATSGLVRVVDNSRPRLFRALPYVW